MYLLLQALLQLALVLFVLGQVLPLQLVLALLQLVQAQLQKELAVLVHSMVLTIVTCDIPLRSRNFILHVVPGC
jgi:hypothetical protein